VAEFTHAYQEEVNRLTKEAGSRTAEIEAKLVAVQRKIDGIMRAIEDGLYQPSMKVRLAELEAEKAALITQQARTETPPNISVHPSLAAVYRKKVEELEQLLEDAEHRDQAMELIRSLIDKIDQTPKEGGGVDALLHGDLARILTLCSTGQRGPNSKKSSAQLALEGVHQVPDMTKPLRWVFLKGLCVCFGCGDLKPPTF
jgi:hypothetical protein